MLKKNWLIGGMLAAALWCEVLTLQATEVTTAKVAEYRAAAEKSDAEAQYNLALCYYCGQGVPQNFGEAAKWFRKAADHGHASAQRYLFHCYLSGTGVEEDHKMAFYWLRKAIKQGDIQAQFDLGYCYECGVGVGEDINQAIYWYRKSAAQGNTTAQKILKELADPVVSKDRALFVKIFSIIMKHKPSAAFEMPGDPNKQVSKAGELYKTAALLAISQSDASDEMRNAALEFAQSISNFSIVCRSAPYIPKDAGEAFLKGLLYGMAGDISGGAFEINKWRQRFLSAKEEMERIFVKFRTTAIKHNTGI